MWVNNIHNKKVLWHFQNQWWPRFVMPYAGISLGMPSQWEMSKHCNDFSHWLGAYLDWSLQSRYVPSQWEMVLHCNNFSHWLGAYLNWSLRMWWLNSPQWLTEINYRFSYPILRLNAFHYIAALKEYCRFLSWNLPSSDPETGLSHMANNIPDNVSRHHHHEVIIRMYQLTEYSIEYQCVSHRILSILHGISCIEISCILHRIWCIFFLVASSALRHWDNHVLALLLDTHWCQIIIGSGSGLAPIWPQFITRTNDDWDLWHHTASLGHND